MSPGGEQRTGAGQPDPAVLPEPVRKSLVERAAACLGALEPAEIPTTLRRVARFEPRRRARLAAAQIAATLERDEAFRGRVADALRTEQPELAAGVESGDVPAAVDPVEIAVAAYLLRPDGWEDVLAGARVTAGREVRERREAVEVSRLREQLDAARAEGDREAARLTERLEEARAEVRLLRGRVHDERKRTHAAEERAEAAETARDRAVQEVRDAREATTRMAAEARRLQSRIAELEAQVEAGRRAGREERSAEAARLAVLVEALLDAASGLRRELALPTATERPADAVAQRYGALAGDRPAGTGSGADLVDRLLAAPQAHLIVDGYNVTKTRWPELTLQEQRSRLLAGLTGLASQVRVEVTCVFDGADLGGRVPAPAPRGVRVLFSPAGVTADEVIAELVRAEPAGRRFLVVSSDREVADAVRRAGADAVPADVLVQRLTRS